MARADSTILVKIVGDAKGLSTALGTAEKKVGGFGGKVGALGGVIAGAFAVDAVLDFAQTALGEADRIGDALGRLEATLGTDITKALDAASTGFENLGLSRQDVLDIDAAVADLATHAGLSADQIKELAEPLTIAAGAMAQITDLTPDEVIQLIGKAAEGSDKALRTLGINLSDAEVEARALKDTGKDNADALTDQDKAAARYALILEKLDPKVRAVTDASQDLEGQQKELEARFETLTGTIGTELQPVVQDLLHDFVELGEWLLDALGMIGDVAEAFLSFAADITGTVMGALGGLLDLIKDILGALGDLLSLDFGGLFDRLTGAKDGADDLGRSLGDLPGVTGSGRASDDIIPTSASTNVTINVPPTGKQTEEAVVRSLRDYQNRNGAFP